MDENLSVEEIRDLVGGWGHLVTHDLMNYKLQLEHYSSEIFDRMIIERQRNILDDKENIELCELDKQFITKTKQVNLPVMGISGTLDWMFHRVPVSVEAELFNKDIEQLSQ